MKDSKHPKRWRPAYVCREGEIFGNSGLKEAIYEACEQRRDSQSEQVRVRMAGVLTDLYATDVRYHVDCRASFMCSISCVLGQYRLHHVKAIVAPVLINLWIEHSILLLHM